MQREMYLLPEAARLLRINTTTLKRWLEGDERLPPVIRPQATGSDAVTWESLWKQVFCGNIVGP